MNAGTSKARDCIDGDGGGGGVEIGRRLDRAKNWYKTGENQIRVAT